MDSWIVSQIGAREHYAIPRGLHSKCLLNRLITDFWSPAWANSIPFENLNLLDKFRGRFDPEIKSKVKNFNASASLARAWHFHLYKNDLKTYPALEYGKWFSNKCVAYLRSLKHKPDNFFCFNNEGLESMLFAKSIGAFTILDQSSPGPEEGKIVESEKERFPGWEAKLAIRSKDHQKRQQQEWSTADMVVVNSDWSKKNLIKQGIIGDKISVIPLAFENKHHFSQKETNQKKPLRILWLGTICLRKGIQYLFPAAEKLPNIEFHIAGPSLVSKNILAQAPKNITFHGQVPRIKSDQLYQNTDVFILPTLSDGFALTQLEAMSWGLPVITTANCGEVVQNGWNGFIIPARDSLSIVEKILVLEKDRQLLDYLSNNSLATLNNFSTEKITTRLLSEVKIKKASTTERLTLYK